MRESIAFRRNRRLVARCRGQLRNNENEADVPAVGKETKREPLDAKSAICSKTGVNGRETQKYAQ